MRRALISCYDKTGLQEFARGLVNYDAGELRKIRGAKTAEIEKTLGYKGLAEVIHRDNLVVLSGPGGC